VSKSLIAQDVTDSDASNLEICEISEFTVFYIMEANLNACPHVDIMFGEELVSSIIDTGSETSVISENLYNRLVLAGLPTMKSASLIRYL
jgi:hypothetical protein